MVKLDSKIQASTLIEVLIALTLITISVGIAIMIHTNILYSNRNQMKMKADLLLNEICIEAKATNDYTDEEINTESMIIDKKIESYNGIEFLYTLTLSAKDKEGRKLAERKELVLVYDKSN